MHDAVDVHAREISSGERFDFGSNWSKFLKIVNEDRIAEACKSLVAYLGRTELSGAPFLDIGCGSGLFSLAARRLGAKVVSFDFDPKSVRCAQELKRRFAPNDGGWTIAQGSVLDKAFLSGLGEFDIVYSWGVLHHTGSMWEAVGNASQLVRAGGSLFISIYNDQEWISRRWLKVKWLYNMLPRFLKLPFALSIVIPVEGRAALWNLLRLRPMASVRHWINYKSDRGMSKWHDWIDWIGGYPFEVARPEQVFDFCRARGFELRKLKTCGRGMGCNEFVFVKKN
jgi:2-polyprenyl-6-hydroxyphenyl methylase/3-demethylubiquinone-9 3-methyltransferase